MNKIEEVARALWQADSTRATGRERRTEWAGESEKTKDQHRHSARAAIAAMREPTEAMKKAGTHSGCWEVGPVQFAPDYVVPSTVQMYPAEVYQAMIDAALEE